MHRNYRRKIRKAHTPRYMRYFGRLNSGVRKLELRRQWKKHRQQTRCLLQHEHYELIALKYYRNFLWNHF